MHSSLILAPLTLTASAAARGTPAVCECCGTRTSQARESLTANLHHCPFTDSYKVLGTVGSNRADDAICITAFAEGKWHTGCKDRGGVADFDPINYDADLAASVVCSRGSKDLVATVRYTQLDTIQLLTIFATHHSSLQLATQLGWTKVN